VSILLPKFHPLVWAGCVVLYILCLLEGGNPNPEILVAMPIGIGVALGIAAAAGAGSSLLSWRRQNKAIAAQKLAERRKRRDIKKALGPEMRRARRRLKKGGYGLSEARMQEIREEIQKAIDAQAKGEQAELERGRQGPYGPGAKDTSKQDLAVRTAGQTAAATLAGIRQGEVLGAQQQARDVSTTQHYGASLAGLPSNVAQMQYQTPGLGERLTGNVTDLVTAGATVGAVEKGAGWGGGGSGKGFGAASDLAEKDATTATRGS